MDGPQSSVVPRFEALVRRHHPEVLAYARRRVSEDDAQDVVADVFLAAWHHLEKLPEEPLPWLYRTAYHAVLNSRRQERRAGRLRQRMSRQPQTATPDHADGVAEVSRVREALARLPLRDQEALRLTTWEDLSISEAATLMGTSTTAMKVRLHRARRQLARLLQDGGTSPPSQQTAPRLQHRTPSNHHPSAPTDRHSATLSPAIIEGSP
jgi:RNA polymerase sigma-70 factor (ECF subfamily)